MPEKISDCHHCGFDAWDEVSRDAYEGHGFDEKARFVRFVRCPNCGAQGPNWDCEFMCPVTDKEQAVKVWNSKA